ncbi:UDP-2,4-diacetamido-2,4,6-trideoxy-beta-L-altropyranose hydrolase [Cupriavidus basilensis]|uniref:UDP-2,4-diacetamido-2,4, 6-trideoxy-beta-L-altropyranose hydrolase n=1 Tax=Cupriavidus basilensis TaxID=68895 RepID=UPI00157A3F7E|nr:UDP-2,4-diacetamido-2,4,6-trideoxy-beta-L-altropyranose hydrolase [Cupriavidus basilensis]NUA25404.1 UDP-2,4-diacetamido-2,4,6-trideoxy-beta-L-altropyranose hydrolase [Cupriavidus basilensis]
MKVAIRADASVQIGSGHVMRCLTLADVLRERGAEVRFITRAHPGGAQALIAKRGYVCHLLPAPQLAGSVTGDLAHSAWLGVPWEDDLARSAAVLADWSPQWLVVDHYGLDWRWEQRLRGQVPRILAIDDLADRRHDCDLLLDQNYYSDLDQRYAALVPPHCTCLLGPGYALLRPEFTVAGQALPRGTGPVRRVLLFMGGMDQDNATSIALRGLQDFAKAGIAIDVVLGAGAPHRDQVRALCESTPNTRLHVQVDNMAELMSSADLAIGACGSATWERCFLGLPTIAIVLADNQRRSAHDLAAAGYIVNLGEVAQVTPEKVAQAVAALTADDAGRVAMSRRVLGLVRREPRTVADLIYEGTR